VVVRRHVGYQQGDIFRACHFAEIDIAEAGACARADRTAAAQIGQREVGCAVTAEGGSQDGKQRGVLRDGEDLSGAEGPSARGEIAGEHYDTVEIRFR